MPKQYYTIGINARRFFIRLRSVCDIKKWRLGNGNGNGWRQRLLATEITENGNGENLVTATATATSKARTQRTTNGKSQALKENLCCRNCLLLNQLTGRCRSLCPRRWPFAVTNFSPLPLSFSVISVAKAVRLCLLPPFNAAHRRCGISGISLFSCDVSAITKISWNVVRRLQIG